jgi:hypothetical protein
MKSKHFSIADLKSIVADMRDEDLIDKAATTLLALINEQCDHCEEA